MAIIRKTGAMLVGALVLGVGMTSAASAAQPAPGTVGNAGNKVPPGQTADGADDHNNGWQCDGNNGIGRNNPAHLAVCDPYSSPPPSGGDGSQAL